MMEKSYGILAIKDDKILVIRQVSGDHWTFCKGHKSRFKSESNRETAIRELKEETNLDVMYFINDQTYVQEYPITRKGKPYIKSVCFFLARVTGDLVLQKSEVSDAKWLSRSEAELLLTYDEDKDILRQI